MTSPDDFIQDCGFLFLPSFSEAEQGDRNIHPTAMMLTSIINLLQTLCLSVGVHADVMQSEATKTLCGLLRMLVESGTTDKLCMTWINMSTEPQCGCVCVNLSCLCVCGPVWVWDCESGVCEDLCSKAPVAAGPQHYRHDVANNRKFH